MTTDYIYNPVLRQTKLDAILAKASDLYWSNRTLCDSVMFLGVVGLTACILVGMA